MNVLASSIQPLKQWKKIYIPIMQLTTQTMHIQPFPIYSTAVM